MMVHLVTSDKAHRVLLVSPEPQSPWLTVKSGKAFIDALESRTRRIPIKNIAVKVTLDELQEYIKVTIKIDE